MEEGGTGSRMNRETQGKVILRFLEKVSHETSLKTIVEDKL